MKIAVLLKQTFDTEEKIVISGNQVIEDGVKFIINPYDEYAVEEAVKQKEEHGGSVTVISVGTDRITEALKTGLAMGADEAVRIEASSDLDEYSLSKLLANYCQSQQFDLIIAGNFSVDNGAGQVAIRVAQLLDIPHISAITDLVINNKEVKVIRDAEGNTEKLTATLPILLTAQQGLNEPRYPSLQGIMKARKKPLHTLSVADLALGAETIGAKTKQLELSLPEARKAGKILSGDLRTKVQDLLNTVQIKGDK